MSDIVLATLNARYAHASLGLRCLRANLGGLRDRSCIREFVIGQKTEEIAEKILSERPRVLGLGVYIWNVEESTRLVAQLRVLAPDLVIVLGGPEVSYETDGQRICALADYVITGWGDVSFAQLAAQLIADERPEVRTIKGIQPPLPALQLPYAEYTDEDVRQRHLYVEASRGCPFKCEFCLSALDKTAWPFPVEAFLAELETLYARGARQFKFVDRTFNLKIDASLAILDFFLAKLDAAPDDPPFLHFELVPDHLPERLKDAIVRFPAGTLQFEIGIQTFDPQVQARISRRQKNDVAADNLRWLRANSTAHLHVDLIAGLPGEDMQTFAAGFDRLVALAPHEIQFGILKRLRGAPIARHTAEHGLRFNQHPGHRRHRLRHHAAPVAFLALLGHRGQFRPLHAQSAAPARRRAVREFPGVRRLALCHDRPDPRARARTPRAPDARLSVRRRRRRSRRRGRRSGRRLPRRRRPQPPALRSCRRPAATAARRARRCYAEAAGAASGGQGVGAVRRILGDPSFPRRRESSDSEPITCARGNAFAPAFPVRKKFCADSHTIER